MIQKISCKIAISLLTDMIDGNAELNRVVVVEESLQHSVHFLQIFLADGCGSMEEFKQAIFHYD